MYEFVYEDKDVVSWVSRNLRGYTIDDLSPCVGIGLKKDNEMIAGCIYNNFRGHDIEVTFAATSPNWATKKNIGVFLSYPFEQLKLARVTAIVAKPNRRARKMVERLGFVLEGVARRGMDGKKDACIYGMLASECKWLRYKHG